MYFYEDGLQHRFPFWMVTCTLSFKDWPKKKKQCDDYRFGSLQKGGLLEYKSQDFMDLMVLHFNFLSFVFVCHLLVKITCVHSSPSLVFSKGKKVFLSSLELYWIVKWIRGYNLQHRVDAWPGIVWRCLNLKLWTEISLCASDLFYTGYLSNWLLNCT